MSGVDRRLGYLYCSSCSPVSVNIDIVDVTLSEVSGSSMMDDDPDDVACDVCGLHPRDWPRKSVVRSATVEHVRCKIF